MAIRWADSFDHYGTTSGGRPNMLSGAWAQFDHGNGADPEVNSTQARTGTYSLRLAHNSLATGALLARRVFGTSLTVAGIAFGAYFDALPATNNIHGFSFRDGANASIVDVYVQSDGALAAYALGVLVGTSDPVITASSWNHIEAKLVCDEIVGSVEVRVNGLAVLNVTDIDTGPALSAAAIRFGSFTTGGGNLTWYIDDVVAWDDSGTANNDFLGTQRVETIFPVADTAEADWTITGGSGPGYDAINDPDPDGDTSFISSDLAGDISEFGLDALPPETEEIAGVYIPAMAKLVDAGTGNLKVSLVSGVAVDEGPDTVLTTAYQYWGSVFETDPATTLAWTKAGLEAALVRVEKTV